MTTAAVSSEVATNAMEIRASAGTGKTFQLSNHFLNSLLDGARPDQVLASTFTRNAAGEILARVLSRLARAAQNEPARLRLALELERDELPDCGALQALLEDLTKSLHRLRICTLDAFFVRVAESFSLELGLPPGWRILDDDTERPALHLQAIDQLLDRQSSRAVVRLVHLITGGHSRRSVTDLLLTSTGTAYELFRDATHEAWSQFGSLPRLSDEDLIERVERARDVEVSHQTLSRQHAKAVEHVEAERWTDLLEIGFIQKLFTGDLYQNKPLPEALRIAWSPLIDHARAFLLQDMATQTRATRDLLGRFHQEFESVKRRDRKLGFDDITRSLSASAARQNEDAFEFRLDSRVTHLLLDEFQDTSMAQWKTLRPMVQRVVRRRTDSSFFVVGDVKQAIYGWRGGVSRIFDVVADEVPGIQSDILVKSYRSCPAVIEAVNKVFSNMTAHENLADLREGVSAWQDAFEEHETARVELPGYVDLTVTGRVEKDSADRDDKRILDRTAEKIRELTTAAPSLSIGVLTRRNEPIRRLVYRLRRMGISASEEGGNAVTDSAPVLAVQSLIQLTDHPGDSACAFHVASTPLGEALGLTDVRDPFAVRRIASEIRRLLVVRGYGPTLESLFDAIRKSLGERDLRRMRQLVDLGFDYDHRSTLRPSDFVRFIDQTRMTSASTDRVRVMTIHKAKGLQFDVVILPELDQQLVGQMPGFAWQSVRPADPPECVSVWRKRQLQQMLPDELQQVFTASQKRLVEEAISLLYVSMTRAVHSIHMIVKPSSERESKTGRTSTGLIRAAVGLTGRLEPEAHHDISGDPNWLDHMPDDVLRLPRPRRDSSDSVRVELAPMPDGRQRSLQTRAPSSHAQQQRIRLTQQSNTPSDAELYGTMVHTWFEHVGWLEDGVLTDDEFRNTLVDPAVSRLDIDGALGAFRSAIAADEIRRLLTRDFYTKAAGAAGPAVASGYRLPLCCGNDPMLEPRVEQERRFAVRIDGQIVQGSIDRLVLLVDKTGVVGADIVDFKTDEVAAAQVRVHSVRYHEQILLYRRAVSQMFALRPGDDITARLVFTKPKRVVDCDAGADGLVGRDSRRTGD